jgi:hypothetical protein
MRYLLILVLCLGMVGCKSIPNIKIEQRTEIFSYLNNEFLVETLVWAEGKNGVTLESRQYNYHVKCEDIKEEKAIQMKNAIKIKEQVEEKIKTYKKCGSL